MIEANIYIIFSSVLNQVWGPWFVLPLSTRKNIIYCYSLSFCLTKCKERVFLPVSNN